MNEIFFIILMKQLREIQLCEDTEYYQITLLDLFLEIMNQEAYKMYIERSYKAESTRGSEW